MQLYHRITERNGAQADAGRWLPPWVRRRRVHRPRGVQLDVDVRRRQPTAAGGGSCGPIACAVVVRGRRPRSTGSATTPSSTTSPPPSSRGRRAPDGVFVVVHVEVLAAHPAAPSVIVAVGVVVELGIVEQRAGRRAARGRRRRRRCRSTPVYTAARVRSKGVSSARRRHRPARRRRTASVRHRAR